jgi:hypothetical protein
MNPLPKTNLEKAHAKNALETNLQPFLSLKKITD